MAEVNLSIKLCEGLELKNPVITCSGTFGYGAEFSDFMDLNKLGGLVTKAITPEPREGNPPPRIVETPCGILNAIGLENVGLDAFIEQKLPYLRDLDTVVIVNVAGKVEDDYVTVVERLSDEKGVDGFELNISCPNVKEGGIAFGAEPTAAAALVKKVKAVSKLPIITKLSPNVTDITEIARAVEAEGSDALSLVNTFKGMAIDHRKMKPVIGNVQGGLSGPAIKPLALYNVYAVYDAVKIPLVGMGGISNAEDALEFIMAGASVISVGTANFVQPDTAIRIIEGIEKFLADRSYSDISHIKGAAHL